jgi:hypothetical protein
MRGLLVLFALYALPCLILRNLPMTDLPQHEAIVSIMRHMHDPAYGFGAYYEWALDRTLYILPYVLALGLSYLMPVPLAVHVTIFVAVISYPLGLLMLLRALKRPLWLSLLALPLVYNHGFFWGFINFELGLGLAFITLSQLVGSWSRKTGWFVAGLCLLSAITHVYGLLLVYAYSAAWLLVGERRVLLTRIGWTLPGVLALGGWALFATNAPGYGITEWVPFEKRLQDWGRSILGGYNDDYENLLLWAFAGVILYLVVPSLPITWRRWKQLSGHTRIAYLLIPANVVAYLTLPLATPTAKFIHFRHAVIAAMLLPLLIDRVKVGGWQKPAQVALAVVAGCAAVNSWVHLHRFDRESADFNEILDAVPPRSKVAQLTYEQKGSVMRTHAYLHFGAYIQARKGGLFALSFPKLFWNIPIKGRDDSDVPNTPKNMEWAPSRFFEPSMMRFYETLLVRNRPGTTRPPSKRLNYVLEKTIGPWQLYRRVGIK